MKNLNIKTVEHWAARPWKEAKGWLKIFVVNNFDARQDPPGEFRKDIKELALKVYIGFELGKGKPKYPLLRDMVPESWGVSEEELFEAALENTKRTPRTIERWTCGGLEYLEIRGAVNLLPEVGLLKKIADAENGDLCVVPISASKFQIIPVPSLEEYGKKQDWFDPISFLYSHWEYERGLVPDWKHTAGDSMCFYGKKTGLLWPVEFLQTYDVWLGGGVADYLTDASIEGTQSFADMKVRKTEGGAKNAPSVVYNSNVVCYRRWVNRTFNPEIDRDKDPIIIGEGFYKDWEWVDPLKED